MENQAYFISHRVNNLMDIFTLRSAGDSLSRGVLLVSHFYAPLGILYSARVTLPRSPVYHACLLCVHRAARKIHTGTSG